MTFIITAALFAAAVYFAIALIACLHDCLVTRYRRHIAPVIEPNWEEISTELGALIEASEQALFTTPAPTAPVTVELPNSIRGLRDFVRAKSLQDAIKGITGKSVSNLNKDELLEAVELALA
ncbi:MAG: hypothetical protein WBB82_03925 [Limnothrix sp.]